MKAKLFVSSCIGVLLVFLLSVSADSHKSIGELEISRSNRTISKAQGRTPYDPHSFKPPGAPEAMRGKDNRQPPCPYTGNSLGPWNYGDWIADMAFNSNTQTVYQVEVGGGNGIIEFAPPTPGTFVSYCPDPGWGTSQRGIACDPLCNLLYVGGWNQDVIYAVTPPPNCRIKYMYPSPIPGVSGLAYDDICQVLWIIGNSEPDSLCAVDPANGRLISGPFPVFWKCPQMTPEPGSNQAAGLAFTQWVYNPFPPPDYCAGLLAPNQLDYNNPSNYSEILDGWGISHACCQLDSQATTHGWGIETWDMDPVDCHWLSQANPSTWMDNCHYRPELQEPIFWTCEDFFLAPRDLQCKPTDTCCVMTWVNPVEYENIVVYRSWGPVVEPIDTISGYAKSYWDSTCTCTGNWDYYVTGVIGGMETEPSNTCICVKRGDVKYFWDFNESDGGFIHYPVGVGVVDDWEWGAAPMYRPDTLWPQALTCWECGDTANDPVPLTNCWGTILNGPYSTLACCKLVSPWIEIDSCSGLLQICHWHEFENEEDIWDGGNLKIHVWPDSEPQYLIYPCYEIPLGYQGHIPTPYNNCLGCQDGFANYSYALPALPNTRDNGWRISYFDLRAWLDGLDFTGPQTIQFAFHFGSDDYATDDWGWYIKWAKIYHCVPEIEEAFIRGDADENNRLSMADAIRILRRLYIPGEPPFSCDDAADVNDDGQITMADAIYLLMYLYVPGSPRPPQPFPDCGPDPTDDPLDCGHHPCMNEFIRGDCNEDMNVNLADIICIEDYLAGGPEPSCMDAADVDDDGDVDQQDVVYLTAYLFHGGPPPPAPFPDCGRDPTADPLCCMEHPCNPVLRKR